ncbi:PaaI family thioesterase [Weissella ceti]|uniref:PaaI family thioesterase n=1 Tax=Weissella ceti TaxID=759620 RepID=A0ABT3E5D4_9LACO|nr:PaaI family thioesterase [Weissella ceti]MCW0953439.1 PaaI family thioesterase [Weissella ceti]QVK12042.1 PaaI family thioesterase [Weissella ceti]
MTVSKFFHLNAEILTAELVTVTLPITAQTKQPYGVVHGGINALIAEEAASLGANEALKAADRTDVVAVGVDIQTHHLAAVSQGVLEGRATPIHIGGRIQTWKVSIREMITDTPTAFSTVTLTTMPLPK